MKKLVAVLLGLVLLAASAFAASAYYFGRQVETAMANPYKGLEANPYIKLVRRDFQRGVFTSTETVTVEILGDITRATGGSPMLMKAVSKIQHGPLPALSTMAAAIVDTEVSVMGGGLPSVGKPMFNAHTVISHEGTGEAKGTLEATTLEFPEGGLDKIAKLSWDAGEFTLQFGKDMAETNLQGSAPRFAMDLTDGGKVVMTGLRVSESKKVVFPDDPTLHSGNQKFSIDGMQIAVPVPGVQPIQVNKIVYETHAPLNGEFLDVTAKLSIADILVAGQNYGPAQMHMSGRKLHARSMAQVQKAVAGLQQMGNPQPGTDPMAAIQPAIKAVMGMLQHDPEMSLDRLSFNTPNGEVLITAKVRVPGVTAQDAQNFMMLTQKIEAVAELAVPEALLMMPIGPAAASPEMAAAQMQTRQQQIAGLLEQGYIYRDGTLMKSRLEFRAGQVAVNGLPFDPMALAQPRPVPAPAAMPQGRPAPHIAPTSRPLR